ncbi:MAG: 4-hydroxy-tetrahydrodipicolinate reductase [Candidatus Riflebacteria bacterium]|nr:4-hydroxy-tetrahydrodipicolinate reductase [Candidatus Riflebacteria bacterium]
MNKRKVAVIGCLGKMGQTVCRSLLASQEYELATGIDINGVGEDLGQMLRMGHIGVPISSNLQKIISEVGVEIAIDFSTPMVVSSNVAQCLQEGIPVLVGTTGISSEDREKLSLLSEKTGTPVLIVPNFAIGALLMMEFSKKAAQYLPHCEIIEMHHPQKLDKPSGTALLTREIIEKALGRGSKDESVIPIHSVRLPGLTAHQEVIFGDLGQTLTIRHDSFQRESFLPGIYLGLKQLLSGKGLKIGLKL